MFAKRPYKRFPGTWALLSKDTLWVASDHMLYVVLWFITEEYKRFYFRDIQAVIIRRNAIWKYLNIGLPAATALLGILAWTSGEGWNYFFYFLAGFVLLAALANLILGPTCECYLQTAVQNIKLPPLTRVRKAQRVMDNLAPLVAGAQTTDA